MLQDKFKNPGGEYRPIPFWSWNEELKPEEIEKQIEEMKDSGVGGYFMHARSGLKTEYLGGEWYACIEAGIKKGKETGLKAWIYDEEGWPSGFAGGRVPAISPDYYAKYMTLEEKSSVDGISWEDMLAVYICSKDTQTIERVQGKNVCLLEGQVLFCVRRHLQPYYIDVMNKRAVDAFLTTTHQTYYDRFPEAFGREMKGFFTDEPRITCDHFGELAWSDDIPAAFLKAYGYDLMEKLPLLWHAFEGYETVRYDFWRLVSHLFVTSFMKNIQDWCHAHNCLATGHIMMEETIFSQMTSSAGVMPFYEYEDIPGIDWLRRRIESPVIGKQVGSVASQLGKKQVLTESFALTGWNVSFEELKWILEWQYVNGVNLLCQHLQAYSLKGSRKRDYPPSLYTQQSWWNNYRQFNDYVSRLGAALTEGVEQADVLVIHPMRSGYLCYDGTRTEEIRRLDAEFERLSRTLSAEHISYQYGDETIISKYASVSENGFTVGLVTYKTVILPHMYSLDKKTLELLLHFAQMGGAILSSGAFPFYTNGKAEDLEKLKAAVRPVSFGEIREEMKKQGLLALSIESGGIQASKIAYQIRKTGEGILLFMVNHSQTRDYNTKIMVYGKKAAPILLKAESGETEEISYQAAEDTSFRLSFAPMQSYLVLLKETSQDGFLLLPPEEQIVALPDHWTIEAMGKNSLTLDTCACTIDGEIKLAPMPAIKVMKELLDRKRPCEIELEFEFFIESGLSEIQELFAAIEDAEKYVTIVNGHEIPYKDAGWWKDRSFRKVDIRPYITQGRNTITLKGTFRQSQKVYDVLYGENVYETELNSLTYDMEIESIYLAGDFGVYSKGGFLERERNAMSTDGPFVIADMPKELTGHEFTSQGLLFFAEDLTISQRIHIMPEQGKRIILDYKKPNAPMMEIYVNKTLVKTSMWADYQADITDMVKPGENQILLHVFASNRNLLGPHHHISGECYNVGPESFTGKWSWVERESESDATDIEDRDKNYWTDSYSFVKFGV